MKTFLLLTAFFAFPAFASETPCGYLGGCDFVVTPPPPPEPGYDGPKIGEKVDEEPGDDEPEDDGDLGDGDNGHGNDEDGDDDSNPGAG